LIAVDSQRCAEPCGEALTNPADDLGEGFVTAAQRYSPRLRSAEEQALGRLTDIQIIAAMQALAPQFANAVFYADVVGLSYKEIGKITNTSVETVMTRLDRGRRRLRSALAEVAEQRGHRYRGAPVRRGERRTCESHAAAIRAGKCRHLAA
jgi:DNA-directed RNA polymerase specialized sigma24 family protein